MNEPIKELRPRSTRPQFLRVFRYMPMHEGFPFFRKQHDKRLRVRDLIKPGHVSWPQDAVGSFRRHPGLAA